MPGRPPKSTAAHKADGTFEPGRHANRLTVRLADGIPDFPADFDDRHAVKWNNICELLKDAGILANHDVDAIRHYVEMDIITIDALAAYRKSKARADFNTYRDSLTIVLRLIDSFGLSPLARMRIKVEKKPPVSKALEAMQGGKRKTG